LPSFGQEDVDDLLHLSEKKKKEHGSSMELDNSYFWSL